MRLLPVELLEKLYGTRYGIVVVTAKRVMRLCEGSTPLVETEAHNPLTIALLELAAGKIHPVAPSSPASDETFAEQDTVENAEAQPDSTADNEEIEAAEA